MIRFWEFTFLLAGVGLLAMSAMGQTPSDPERAPETGLVTWQRDFEAAQKISATSKRPLFVLFQEIPG